MKGYPTLMLHKGDGAEGTKCACAAGARREPFSFLTVSPSRPRCPHRTADNGARDLDALSKFLTA